MEIKKRPQLFLNEKSLRKLGWVEMGFMFGYNNAFDQSIIEFANETKNSIWTNFSKSLCKKYGICTPDYSELIAHCGSEEKAFDLFFEELELFLKQNNISI